MTAAAASATTNKIRPEDECVKSAAGDSVRFTAAIRFRSKLGSFFQIVFERPRPPFLHARK